jgi:hypothetical protein
MAGPNRYPSAAWTGNGVDSGSYTSGPFKVVLHTTETRTIPGYAYGKTAPHLTYSTLNHRWIQHTDLTVAARSLQNAPGGPQTNRDSALQVEIVCYSARNYAIAFGGIWVGELDDETLTDIREFLEWASEEFGVAMRWPGKQALSWSEANAPGFRMSPAEWDAFDGVCGHQHIPEGNVHWDPGALNWGALLEEAEMALSKGAGGPAVTTFQIALLNHDPDSLPRFGSDGDFGNETVAAVQAFQDEAGLPVTGSIDGITAAMLLDSGILGIIGQVGPVGPAGPPGAKGPRGHDGVQGDAGTVTISVDGEVVC